MEKNFLNIICIFSYYQKAGLNVLFQSFSEAATRGALWEKVLLEISQNSQENTCAKPEACNFIKKETLAQVFSFEFYEISKNTFFHRTLLVAASGFSFKTFLIKFSKQAVTVTFFSVWISSSSRCWNVRMIKFFIL